MTGRAFQDDQQEPEGEEPGEMEGEEGLIGDPLEPGKTETLSPADSEKAEMDKLIGKGLKLPPVQDDGRW